MCRVLRLSQVRAWLHCDERAINPCGWRLLPNENVHRMDENGEILLLPVKNIAMFHPLKRRDFPAGAISLEGNDW